MRRSRFLYLSVFLLWIISCSTIRNVKPVPEGQSNVSLSLGGPITAVGKGYLPLPLLSAGYSYGFTPRLSLESGIGITNLLFGIVQIDGGVNYHLFEPDNALPGVFSSCKLFFNTNFEPKSVRVYPALNLGFYWEWKKHLVYTGVDNWIEFSSVRSDGNSQTSRWLPAPYLGYGLMNKKWTFQVETKLYTPNVENWNRPVDNLGMGDYGVFGVFAGVSRYFGGEK